MKQCGAKTRSGAPCRKVAMENGRCKLHGGKSPKGIDSPTFKHGRYSKYLPDNLRAAADAFNTQDALDLSDELSTQRALVAEYIGRYRDGALKLPADEIFRLLNWFEQIGRMAERIMKMRNDSALTGAEIQYLQMRAVDVAMKYFDDPDTREQFIADLFGVPATDRAERLVITAGTPRGE